MLAKGSRSGRRLRSVAADMGAKGREAERGCEVVDEGQQAGLSREKRVTEVAYDVNLPEVATDTPGRETTRLGLFTVGFVGFGGMWTAWAATRE
ncbi:hypothetical protein LX36DRAFT_664524 [Colletotrichum falcatum]|nr:hypothetical protein LX36DRAFT_664524 [Colletotrichum falcatum]